MPAIGLVMVSHAFMDQQLQIAICAISGIDYSSGVSFMSEVSTNKRAEMFKNLAKIKEDDLHQLAKMLVIGDMIGLLSNERNILAHTIPHSRDASSSKIGYFKDKNKTFPQISVQPPYTATVDSLEKLASEMFNVGIWLGALQKTHVPDGSIEENCSYDEMINILNQTGTRHPMWYDDMKFPWRDKYLAKLTSESRKPQNRERNP